MQRWRWVYFLLQPKYVPCCPEIFLLLRSYGSVQIILAQAERDQSVHSLLQKLNQVYGFITRDDNLSKIESMHDVVGKIAQQTLECARFIREYSETKSFCESSDYCIRIWILYLL
jgi:hypothetical protein